MIKNRSNKVPNNLYYYAEQILKQKQTRFNETT
jgi:hypothetical protein